MLRNEVEMRLIALLSLILWSWPAMAQDVSFRTPTGNIYCMIFNGSYVGARCDLLQVVPAYERPSDCDLDWGFAFEVGAKGPGAPICAGDSVRVPGARVLDYGHSITAAGITCTSRRIGLTCLNSQGHGFTVARAGQSAF